MKLSIPISNLYKIRLRDLENNKQKVNDGKELKWKITICFRFIDFIVTH